MFLLLLVLLGIIFGYGYLTNPARIRAMAQAYLSHALGGPVEVGNATLSIFQGLRLDNVKVKVDQSGRPDSVLLTAQTFLVRYDLKEMLGGNLEARQIVAINPRLYLSEDLDTGQRNYQRLMRRTGATSRPRDEQGHPIVLPEVLLRNAEVEYSEISNGEHRSLGHMRIDGQIEPAGGADQYHFAFQSRDAAEGIGPIASGTISTATGAVEAKLTNFQFNQTLLNILPSVVRQWAEDHQLSGGIDVPMVRYVPAHNGTPAQFRVEAALKGVSLSIHPREWMGREEIARRAMLQRTQNYLRAAGGNVAGAADVQTQVLEVTPLSLDHVTGTFIFTPAGIDIHGLTGRLASNALQIEGHIDGYSPDAPMTIRMSSLEGRNLYLPPAPDYIKALPGDLRELYEHLRPQGTCRFWTEAVRPEPGAAIRVRGQVDILEGQFVFDLFPYPLRRAAGTITFGPDPRTGADRCDIVNLQGLGVAGGPNENTSVVINASIVPLGGHAEVNVTVQADRVVSEPMLIEAMPPEVRQTLRLFGQPEAGRPYPSFSGGFVCHVHRPPGAHQKWLTTVDLQIADSQGAFSLFPYPLEHMRGKLHIGDHFVDIQRMTMLKGNTSLTVDGRVSFAKEEPLKPDLTITARNVPLDKAFIDAIPGDRRQWVRNAGLGGTLDIDGRVFRPDDEAPIRYELDIAVHDGSIWPAGATFALAKVDAKLHLTPDALILKEFQGRRGDAQITGSGALMDMDQHPRLKLSAQARDLAMEPALYQLLPAGGKQAWDEVRPSGTLNAAFTCDLDLNKGASTTQPAEAPPSTQGATRPALASRAPTTQGTRHSTYSLTLQPVKLSLTPQVMPYRLDDVTGAIRISDQGVILDNMTARHGAAKLTLSGTGSPGSSDEAGRQGVWDLKLTLADALVDSEFKTALPPALRDLFEALQLQGTISTQFDRLVYRAGKEPDVDFAGRVWLKDASLETGVDLRQVNGRLDLKGNVRQGKLNELQGTMNIPTLNLSGRPATNLRGQLTKLSGQEAMSISHLQGGIAGGEMAGQVDLSFPDQGPSRYTLGLVLRNADVQQLAGDGEHDIRGQLSASLSLEGDWSDPASRRGRGDVTASGKQMYRIPLLLGLMQITNLSLPISQPFNQASARYSVEGNHVTFEQIELRSDTLAMQGSGQLDFGTKKVHLGFVVDNPNGLKVPFFSDLFNGFKQELLQIHVNGSITQAAGTRVAAGTYQTTVDKVYRGGND